MSNITGKFVKFEASVETKAQSGKMYQAWKLTYEDEKGDFQKIVKPAKGLEYVPALKNGMENLQPGDFFVMEREKKGEFLNPTKIYKSNGATLPPATQAAPAVSSSGPNTFEVNNQLKEKQMKFDVERQPIYVRQTALKAASELADVLNLKTEQAVLEQAKRFVKFIEAGDSGSIEDMISDDLDIE